MANSSDEDDADELQDTLAYTRVEGYFTTGKFMNCFWCDKLRDAAEHWYINREQAAQNKLLAVLDS